MSDGKSFQLDLEKSIEDRLADIEKIWPFIQDKLQTYDKALGEFNSVKGQLDGVKQSISSNASNIATQNSHIPILKEKINQGLASHDTAISALSDAVNTNAISQAAVSNKIDSIEEEFDKFKLKASDILSSLTSNADFKPELDIVKSNLNTLIQDIEIKVNLLSSNHSVLSNAITAFNSYRSQIESDKSSLTSKIFGMINEITAQTNKVSQDVQGQKIKLDYFFNDAKDYINTMIEKVRMEMPKIPDIDKNLNTIRADFAKAIESHAIDTSNAILRTSNTAKAIQIIEKKIENIYLLLKQSDLDK